MLQALQFDYKIDTDRTFFKRKSQIHHFNRLTVNCMCENILRTRTWVSNSENIFLYPLNYFFNGPKTKSLTIVKSLDLNECSNLTEDQTVVRAIEDACSEVEDKLNQ